MENELTVMISKCVCRFNKAYPTYSEVCLSGGGGETFKSPFRWNQTQVFSSNLICQLFLYIDDPRTDNIAASLINSSSQNKVYYSRETFSDYSKMIVFPFLNPQMIKVAFSSWLLNFNSIKEDEADQTNTEGSISILFFFFFCLSNSFISSPWLCQLFHHPTNKYVRQIELHAPNTHHNYRRSNKKMSHLAL